jgi:hypothetical protein
LISTESFSVKGRRQILSLQAWNVTSIGSGSLPGFTPGRTTIGTDSVMLSS